MIERDTHVRNFAKNRDQKEAVKAFILESLQPQNWLSDVPLSLNDEEYGQRVKSSVKARISLEAAFEEMDKLLDEPKPKDTTNQAR